MNEALLKNGPTSDMEEIKEAVDTLLHAMVDGEEAPKIPVIQVNQAAFSDLRCYFDMDQLVEDGWIIVGDVMSRDGLDELFEAAVVTKANEPVPCKCGSLPSVTSMRSYPLTYPEVFTIGCCCNQVEGHSLEEVVAAWNAEMFDE